MHHPIRHNEYKILLAFVTGKTKEWIFLNFDKIKLSATQQKQLDECIKRRITGEPIAKIIGYKEFYSRNFFTNAHTLDPRADSEVLIDAVKTFYKKEEAITILDLGLGTGCLLFTLLSELPNASGLGADKSFKALEVAFHNRQNLGLTQRACLINSDWTNGINAQFDVIVTNPPYIAPNTNLDSETMHDPHEALFAAENGTSDYKKIFSEISTLLKPESLLFLEIGKDQFHDVDLLATTHGLKLKKTFQDLAGIDRVLCYCKQN
jgi:release factor glutamine methyltransferase